MINKEVAKLLEKYTFVEKAEIKGTYLHLHYRNNDIYGLKRISTRTTKKLLIEILEKLKKDIGYYEDKKIRDAKVKEALAKERNKPLIFVN